MTDQELRNLLRNIDRPRTPPPPPASPRQDRQQGPARPNSANVASNPNLPVSRSEQDAIREHVSRFWNVPIGARDAENLVVDLRIECDPDGTVRNVRLENSARMASDPMYRAAADSAMRAVRMASPLPIPAGKAAQFRDFILSFNPRQLMGLGG